MFKRTYTLSQLTIDGASALSNGALSYRDTCTVSGCDVKQREYLSGSARYLVQVDANLRKILHDMDMKPKKICTFKSIGGEVKRLIRQGTYNLGGVNYKALKFSSTEEGDIYCEGGNFGRWFEFQVCLHGQGQAPADENRARRHSSPIAQRDRSF